ncbi:MULTISPECIES: pseudouridine synthase [Flavobacterium]|uniref:Ribosomal large subunit pseudouridine synthase F n=2 Tax=Flavobacterium TaxID=237 RepID=A0A2N9PBK4_9FLAO|nr:MULTISPECIES: pseudouridine synthase [Flavobacterium]OWP84616.1 pseudouridylate synthase [Flavobacterium davisii]RVU91317.1 rRNA pseudouridine synthase [Flavobacterium columnare]SPE77703.1 Ribosomal large subunit pseudouridine synthase F [Flavobacterium columnare]
MIKGRGNNKRSNTKPTFGKREGGNAKPNFKKSNLTNGKPKFERKPKLVTSLEEEEIRLNKYISNSGICSRRDADIYIQSGNVRVNGEVVTEMGYKVKTGDVVNFDGSVVTPEKKEYILLNKPKGFTTSKEEDLNANNVLDLVRGATKAKLQPVGRMDKTTTGLLLFTNDTDMVRKFTQPNQRSPKIYQVTLDRNLKYEDLEKIQKGLYINEHKIMVDEVSYIENAPKSEVGLQIKTANVKIVRSLFESLEYNVLKVDRVAFAGLTKKNLPRGNWRFLTNQEIINLKNI